MPNHPHETPYTVNGEEEATTEDSLTVREILENAGFTPAADYSLKSENPPRAYENYDEQVRIHPHQRFQAQFKGPTQTS